MLASTDLLHPEARHRTIKQTEQGEMILLGGMAGQLDDWRRTVEDRPTAVEHEVVVGGDKGKGDAERRFESFSIQLT
jgi:hypothetical protein